MKKYGVMAVTALLAAQCFLPVFAQEIQKKDKKTIEIETIPIKTKEVTIDNIVMEEEQSFPNPEDYIPVLMYHHFRTDDVPDGDGANMHIREFEEQLQALQEAGYETIFLSELNEILLQKIEEKNAGVTQPELHLNQKYVVITIDDGYRSNYELAYPLLKKYNMKANISVITSRIHTGYIYSTKEIEKMSWENLNEMQQSGLVEIYSHTYDHKPVENRMYTDVRSSVEKGEQMLDKELQQRSKTSVLTYPNGNYRKEISVMMRAYMGFDLQLTTNSDVVNRNTSILEIPRITVNSGTGKDLISKIHLTAEKTFLK